MGGTLFVVATPIGNQADFSDRGRVILSSVDEILAEDTRHSGHWLRRLEITTPLSAFHEHNERDQSLSVLKRLQAGEQLALISDAGTPLMCDPGYSLVQAALSVGISVVPIPGPCSIIAALSVSGLPTDSFVFLGFVPAKGGGKKTFIESLKTEHRTSVFFEVPHRIVSTLTLMSSLLGAEREISVCRELTKKFETVRYGTLQEITEWVTHHPDQQKGEFVICVKGNTDMEKTFSPESDKLLKVLLESLDPSHASKILAKYTGLPRRACYERAMLLS